MVSRAKRRCGTCTAACSTVRLTCGAFDELSVTANRLATCRTHLLLDDARDDAATTEQVSTRCHRQVLDRLETDDARLVGVVVDARHDRVEVADGRLLACDLFLLLLLALLQSLAARLQHLPETRDVTGGE